MSEAIIDDRKNSEVTKQMMTNRDYTMSTRTIMGTHRHGVALICYKQAGLSQGYPCEMPGVQHNLSSQHQYHDIMILHVLVLQLVLSYAV